MYTRHKPLLTAVRIREREKNSGFSLPLPRRSSPTFVNSHPNSHHANNFFSCFVTVHFLSIKTWSVLMEVVHLTTNYFSFFSYFSIPSFLSSVSCSFSFFFFLCRSICVLLFCFGIQSIFLMFFFLSFFKSFYHPISSAFFSVLVLIFHFFLFSVRPLLAFDINLSK